MHVDTTTNIWIVHPKRDRMHRIEIERGFEGIYNDLSELFDVMAAVPYSSATVLIHDGYLFVIKHSVYWYRSDGHLDDAQGH